MALLKSCVSSRCSINILFNRRFEGLSSLMSQKNTQRINQTNGALQVRKNATIASLQNSYNNFFKSVTESDAVDFVKEGLILAHDVTGLPWGWTIILTTLGLRATITFPLGVYQVSFS